MSISLRTIHPKDRALSKSALHSCRTLESTKESFFLFKRCQCPDLIPSDSDSVVWIRPEGISTFVTALQVILMCTCD